jgi:hypothetical protein
MLGTYDMLTLTDSQWRGQERTKPILFILEIFDSASDNTNPVAWLLVERIKK